LKVKHFGMAVLIHAGIIGSAWWVVERPQIRDIQLTTLVTSEVQNLESTNPDPNQSPKPEGAAWPELHQAAPGSVPVPTEVILPEPEPQPEPEPPAREIAQPEGSLGSPTRNEASQAEFRKSHETAETPPDTPIAGQPGAEGESSESTTPAGGPKSTNQVIESPDMPPRIISPDWPRSVRKRFNGSVLVEVVVMANGKASAVKMIEGTGQDDWDAKLVEVFEEAVYVPGMFKGMPVHSRHRFRVKFRQE